MKNPSLALIINKLQKGTQPQQLLPNTYFLSTDSVLYHCVREGSQGFEAIVVSKIFSQLVLTMCHDILWHNGTTWLYRYIRRFYLWEKWKQDCAKHVHQCRECQQVSLKEHHYVDSNLHIPKLPMSFIVMDLLGKYPETENGNHHTLTVICMLTSFVSIVPMKDKKAEAVINTYIKYIYADKGGSRFIISDNRKEFLSASMAYVADQLGFIKVYTLPYSPHSNPVVERCHSFLKNSIGKIRCYYEADWDQLAHITVMAYNIFPHTAKGENPFFLMYGHDVYLPTLHNLLQQQ